LIAVVIASSEPSRFLLNEGDLRAEVRASADAPDIPWPLMAMLAQCTSAAMAWPLVVCGMFFGVAAIMSQVRSPMLVSVGMYLPFQTTFAIFIGGIIRWIADSIAARRGFNEAACARRKCRNYGFGYDRGRG
jgi:uncharacterized oligopeptide transporter (OPT) family protein